MPKFDTRVGSFQVWVELRVEVRHIRSDVNGSDEEISAGHGENDLVIDGAMDQPAEADQLSFACIHRGLHDEDRIAVLYV